MKKLLTFGILMMLAIAASAEPPQHTLRAPIQRSTTRPQKPVPMAERDIQGVIPRALRGGNPLQMLNPRAPAQYGTAEQSVAFNPLTGKYDQIKFLEIFF